MRSIPSCFFIRNSEMRANERDHGPYAHCNNISWLALTLAAGASPGHAVQSGVRVPRDEKYPKRLAHAVLQSDLS
jgi:hypothetical protein